MPFRFFLLALVAGGQLHGQPSAAVLTSDQAPRSHALIIASNYKGKEALGKRPLEYAEADADALYHSLTSLYGGQFPAQNITRLIGREASLENITRAFETWLPTSTKAGDRVVVYLALHGTISSQDGRGYVLPHEADPNNLAGTAYRLDKIGKAFQTSIQGKWRVLLADTCHSGAILDGNQRTEFNSQLANIDNSVLILTASSRSQASVEGKGWGGGRGIFSYYLTTGFRGEADVNRDGTIAARELARYVIDNVATDTAGEQVPKVNEGSYAPDMVLAHHPGPGAESSARQRYGRIIARSVMNDVDVYVTRDPKADLTDHIPDGTLQQEQRLYLPGLTPGLRFLWAYRDGYEPAGPITINVAPGQDIPVEIPHLAVRRPSAPAEREFKKGEDHLSRDRFAEAAGGFARALSMDPRYQLAALRRAEALHSSAQYAQARDQFLGAIRANPSNPDAHALFAGSLLDQGRPDEAIRHLNRAIQKRADHPFAHYLLAAAFLLKGAFPQALLEAKTAAFVSPKVPEAQFWFAQALRMNEDWATAEVEYRNYLASSEFDSGVTGKAHYYILGSLFGFGRKHRPSREGRWRAMRQLAQFGICDCARLAKDYDRAFTECSLASKQDPRDPYSHLNLGAAQIAILARQELPSTQDVQRAISQYRRVVELAENTDLAIEANHYIRKLEEYKNARPGSVLGKAKVQ